ncbi:uncharacterized protein LOC115876100 isoform X2 [Sitophilus oryzae]|uniref:Uncharacterized protein LOC115876100 isoform X2 n=1 Tax=Sitophilus oryzae TaxID=7048 RepID=A0A6J2X8W9_SITOR|nr:uncharacterized protein LOC115876100 isoform X2 [Sitophilus oryzae]
MKPRHYVHMGMKKAEEVSKIWKAATKSMFEILDMYEFNCIIYAKIQFQGPHAIVNSSYGIFEDTASDEPKSNSTSSKTHDPNETEHLGRELTEYKWDRNYSISFISNVNNSGFLNLRRTVFATILMCDLMLFAPLASVVIAILLGVIMLIGSRGGAGNPGDIFPEIWICTYPILGLCGFMTFFCFVSSNLFQSGLGAFCLQYHHLTKYKWCNPGMDHYTIQFTPEFKGPPAPFYRNYILGTMSIIITPILWLIQATLFLLRIIFLVDFKVYLTKIQPRDKEVKKTPAIAKVATKLMEHKRN